MLDSKPRIIDKAFQAVEAWLALIIMPLLYNGWRVIIAIILIIMGQSSSWLNL